MILKLFTTLAAFEDRTTSSAPSLYPTLTNWLLPNEQAAYSILLDFQSHIVTYHIEILFCFYLAASQIKQFNIKNKHLNCLSIWQLSQNTSNNPSIQECFLGCFTIISTIDKTFLLVTHCKIKQIKPGINYFHRA